MNKLIIGGREFNSRLFVGTGKFSSNDLMQQAILASESEMVTVAMKRVDMDAPQQDDILTHIRKESIQLLPNTSGVRNAEEAVLAAQLAREAFGTNFIKLEIHPDPKYLLPDPIETLKATEELVKMGFVVLPYIQADPVLCKRLEEVGAATVMPLGAPIGTNKGLRTRDLLEIIIAESRVPVVVDAGIGAPSHAAEAMELGADAVLVNTAIAVAGNPVEMAIAFKEAVIAGRRAYEAGLGAPQQQLPVGAVVQVGVDGDGAPPAHRAAQVHIPLRPQEPDGGHAGHHDGGEPGLGAGVGHRLHGVQGVGDEGAHGVAALPRRLKIVHGKDLLFWMPAQGAKHPMF